MLKVGDKVKIIKLNDEWLEIDFTAEQLIGKEAEILAIDNFEVFDTHYKIQIESYTVDFDNDLEIDEDIRTLWLPEEWLEIVE